MFVWKNSGLLFASLKYWHIEEIEIVYIFYSLLIPDGWVGYVPNVRKQPRRFSVPIVALWIETFNG